MADTVDTLVLLNGQREYIVRFTNISDGTGETNVTKITASGILDSNGKQISGFAIKKVNWSIFGFTSVRLYFDATTDDEALVLGSGTGCREFDPPMLDPRSAGTTGNIILSTNAPAAAGNTYDIYLTLVKI